MAQGFGGSMRVWAVLAAAALALGGCSTITDGTPSVSLAANAGLTVVGDSGGQFDTTVKNALSDVLAFWRINYPAIANGASLPPVKGGCFSVDGQQVIDTGGVNGPAARDGCISRSAKSVVNNAFFCFVDDSIVWDRAHDHLVPVLAQKYGTLIVALAFAHEFGHELQFRTGTTS